MNRIYGVILLGVIIVAVCGGIFFLSSNKKSPTQDRFPQKPTKENSQLLSTNINLTAQNDSNENGIAILRETGKELGISLTIDSGFPKDVSQPAHIHKGSCSELGEVVYPLTDVINGESFTKLSTTLSELKKQLPLAINIHKSTTENAVYVSCADITGL